MAINLDEDLDNADWTKSTWDVDMPQNIADLRSTIKAWGMSVADFKKLPVYKRNVDNPKLAFLKEL